MRENLVNSLSSAWNKAITSPYAADIDIPAISLKSLPSAIAQRDQRFLERGGLLLELNHATRNDFGQAVYKTQILDHRKNGRPSLAFMANEYATRLRLPDNSPEAKALMLIAFRAEMDEYRHDKPAYHNPNHYADVFSIMANFIMACRDRGTYFFSKKEETLVLIAAMAHDIKHSGSPNPTLHHVQNEDNSIKAVQGIMKYCGMSNEDIQTVRAMLFATSPNGPHQILKNLIAAHNNRPASQSAPVTYLYVANALDRLKDTPNMLQLTAMLCDADIFAGAGAGMDAQLAMSKLLTKEAQDAGQDSDFTKPQARMYFFDHIVGEDGLTSDIGRHLGNENYQAMRKATQAQLKL